MIHAGAALVPHPRKKPKLMLISPSGSGKRALRNGPDSTGWNLIPCASPSYLERHGRPAHPSDLARHACLGFSGSALEERWTFHGDDGEVVVPIGSRFSANSGHALRQAALAGMGIIHHAEELLADDLVSGRLVRIMAEWRSERPLHILYAPDRRITPKLRSFLDFTTARFSRERGS